ncbi:hypothetical protein G6F65_018881 [Rhizopus arrhizus]|nr:hypothetical protein G6F65_018881 [Rhizopus arrhizus]
MQAPAEVQLAATQQVQAGLRALCVQAQQGTVGALHGLLHRVPLQLHHARRGAAQAQRQFALVRYQQFGGHRWRRRAQVGSEVAEAEVGLVAYRRYHRGAAGRNRASQRFIVERPQFLQ